MKCFFHVDKDKWTLKVLTFKEMKKVSGDKNTAGLCVPYEKTIYIREDSIEYAVISHEILHCYFSYLYLSDTNNITLDDAEEVFASMFAAKGEAMVKKAKSLTRKLLKLQNEEL